MFQYTSFQAQTVINRLPSSGPLVVFHLAYLTQEKVGQNQQRYIQAIDKINEEVSSIVSNNDVNALIYASSGAARIPYDNKPSSAGKSLYGRLKARDEISFGDSWSPVPFILRQEFLVWLVHT